MTMRRTIIIAAATVVVVVLLAWLSLPKPDHPGPRVVHDSAFIDAANARCRQVVPTLRPQPSTDSTNPSPAVIAQRVDTVADGIADLSADLRGLPAAADDRADIDGWLTQWDRYVTIGHQYAGALRTNDQHAQARFSKDGDKVQKSADRFARANGLAACQFFIVPQGNGSDPFSGNGI